MDINKSKNLVEGNEQNQIELKEKFEDDTNEDNSERGIQINNTRDIQSKKKKDLVSETESEGGQPIGKKELETILMNLNSYWLELIGSISLIMSLIIYELIGIFSLNVIHSAFTGEFNFDLVTELFNLLVNDIGLKWLFFIKLSQHLSVGFFCLTTFSNMFRETKNIVKFYVSNCIKVAIFYVISVIILKVIIKDKIGGIIHQKIDDTGIDNREKVYEIFDKIIDKALIIVADFLSTYNTFIEKLTLGSLYICLFYEPKAFMGSKMIYFRLLSLIPIIYIIVSLIIRALHNTKVIVLSEFVSPILLGPKIVVYLFFISCLALIKYKSIRFNVFDSENYINPKVFSNIGSKCFGILGIIELIIGLFFPSFSAAGIGGKYLLVICAPIMTLYDYKRQYKLHFPFCKRGDFSLCIKLCVNIIGYILIVILGIVLFIEVLSIFVDYIQPLIEFVIDQFDLVVQIMDLVL